MDNARRAKSQAVFRRSAGSAILVSDILRNPAVRRQFRAGRKFKVFGRFLRFDNDLVGRYYITPLPPRSPDHEV